MGQKGLSNAPPGDEHLTQLSSKWHTSWLMTVKV
jgi:hypothetical protein